MDGALQRKQAYRLIDELPLDRLGVVIQMLEMITGKQSSEKNDASVCTACQAEDAAANDTNTEKYQAFLELKEMRDEIAKYGPFDLDEIRANAVEEKYGKF